MTWSWMAEEGDCASSLTATDAIGGLGLELQASARPTCTTYSALHILGSQYDISYKCRYTRTAPAASPDTPPLTDGSAAETVAQTARKTGIGIDKFIIVSLII